MRVMNAKLAVAIYKFYGANCGIKGTNRMNDRRRTAAASSPPLNAANGQLWPEQLISQRGPNQSFGAVVLPR